MLYGMVVVMFSPDIQLRFFLRYGAPTKQMSIFLILFSQRDISEK